MGPSRSGSTAVEPEGRVAPASVPQSAQTGAPANLATAAENPQSYYDASYHGVYRKVLLHDDEIFWARSEATARAYFTPEDRTLRVFEYGCGLGQAIASLKCAAGWDLSSEARGACRRRGLKVYERLEEVPGCSWDIVFCCHVLEHLEEPLAALRRMRGLLAPGGRLLLVLPKEGHWLEPIRSDWSQHLYCWNFRAINNLLFRAGFRPISNRYHHAAGWHRLVPVKRLLGMDAYVFATRLGAILRRNGELLTWARPEV